MEQEQSLEGAKYSNDVAALAWSYDKAFGARPVRKHLEDKLDL